ncbi:MAG: DUF1194 domain-containing protein, partial [Gemmobacter sp.]
MLWRVLALAAVLILPDRGRACEAALVLAMDVSGSVDAGEYRLQVDGLAAALRDPEVREVLLRGQVALTVIQWSSTSQQHVSLPWRRMLSEAEVARFAERVETMPRAFVASDTAVGAALLFSLTQFEAVPDCKRRIVDGSGDGPENAGFMLPQARAAAVGMGVEVNGLAIESIGLAITTYFRGHLVTPGGFVETAAGHME